REVRHAAILACGLKDVPALIEDLKPLLKDNDPRIVESAARSLSQLDPSFASDIEADRLRKRLVETPAANLLEVLEDYRTGKGKAYQLALARALPDLPMATVPKGREVLVDRLSALPLEELREQLKATDREMRLAAVMASKK